MKISSWNVNSIKARLPNLLRWLEESKPDLVCLQELKCIDAAFPREEIETLGYNIESFGQKAYNGVALLSRYPLEDVSRGLPNFEDEQSRYIEAVISTPSGALRFGGLYLPNGNPVYDDTNPDSFSTKYNYKLNWMKAFKEHVQTLLSYEETFILAGDYNVIPNPKDCYNAEGWRGDASFRDETEQIYRSIVNLGLTDALSSLKRISDETYTFWDYQAGAWQKNNGIRIDHHLLSPLAADKLCSVEIEKHVRGWDKPSDHVPISIILDVD